MSVAGFIDRQSEKVRKQTERMRQQQFNEGKAEGLRVAAEWIRRKDEHAARGEPFDEPIPDREEAERIKRDAIESTFLHRLQQHWIWPHLVIFILVCLVIDVVALGYALVWVVKYVAGIEGSGTVLLITTGSLLALGAYWYLYKFIRWLYG